MTLVEQAVPWAMQLVLRDERTDRATHLAACEAAATAAVRLIDDERSAPGGGWHAAIARWDAGPIRKVVRRARGARFEATAVLEGVQVMHRGAMVRAFVPGPTDRVPAELARLQVGGTQLPDLGEPAPPVPGGLVVALAPLPLSTGKAAAQCGHAAHLAWRTLEDDELKVWRATGFAVRVLAPDAPGWERALARARVRVTDGGFTEVAPGTVTALAWPELAVPAAPPPERMNAPAPVELTGPRVLLRPLLPADADSLFAIFSDPKVMRYWSSPPWTRHAQAVELIEEATAAADGSLRLAIVRREDLAVIGTVSLFDTDLDNRRAEIGYVLARAAWGAGFAAEAVRALVDHAFGELGVHRLEADIDPRNEASARLLERLGFRREGLLRERWIVAGEVSDSAIYGLLRTDRPGA